MPDWVYLDTVLWNRLCDLEISPSELEAALAPKSRQIVMSTQVVHELAKTFQGKRKGARERGVKLFKYLQGFVDRQVPCIRQNPDLLRDEARIANKEMNEVELVEPAPHYSLLVEEVQKLGSGVFDARADSFISRRKDRVTLLRADAARIAGLQKSPMAPYYHLPLHDFIRKAWERFSRRILLVHLHDVFPSHSLGHLKPIAKAILRSPSNRVAHAMVRGDLYMNWHVERHGSIPRDHADDTYHVVNAAYCDIYATCEISQASYVPAILKHTRLAVFDGSGQVLEWLAAV